MNTYEFLVVLDAEPGVETTERLYEYYGANGAAPAGVHDFTIVTTSGTPTADCTVEAPSLEAALGLVLPILRREGVRAVRVELDAEGLAMAERVG